VRPAVYAALELGVDTLWATLEPAIRANNADLLRGLRRIAPGLSGRDLEIAAQSLRRLVVGVLMDRTATPGAIGDALRAFVAGWVMKGKAVTARVPAASTGRPLAVGTAGA
jgi:hypothetical protein